MKTKDNVKISIGDLLIAENGDIFEVSDIYGSKNECYLYKVRFTRNENGVQWYETYDLTLVSVDFINTLVLYREDGETV